MFQVKNIKRIDAETVLVIVTMQAKDFAKAKKQGLGQLLGIDISNHVYREYGVKAYNPTVDGIRDRASKGIKTLKLYYADNAWQAVNNVVRPDFGKSNAVDQGKPCQVISVDFKRRAVA